MNLFRLMLMADIIHAAQTGSKVGRLVNDDIIVGIARSIGSETGGFANSTDDVESLFLRVTSLSGWDYFWPMATLADERKNGTFAPDYHN